MKDIQNYIIPAIMDGIAIDPECYKLDGNKLSLNYEMFGRISPIFQDMKNRISEMKFIGKTPVADFSSGPEAYIDLKTFKGTVDRFLLGNKLYRVYLEWDKTTFKCIDFKLEKVDVDVYY